MRTANEQITITVKLLKLTLCLSLGFSSQVFAQAVDTVNFQIRFDSLIKISRELANTKQYDKALEINTVLEDEVFKVFGKDCILYATLCFNKGRILKFKGAYKDAESSYLESKSIREKYLGKQHPDYAWSLNNLASLYLDLGLYDKAEPLYLESKLIRQNVLGKNHPDFSGSLNNLANLYMKMGYYEKAEPFYIESRELRLKISGANHSAYAISLNNLANLYVNMGMYEKAEPLYLEAKSLLEKNAGINQSDLCANLNNLAAIYWEMGNYEKAESYYLESKNIHEKLPDHLHPEYAMCLNNLAILYLDMGYREKAEPLYLEAKSLREKIFGKYHPEYATSINSLANFYIKIKEYDKAGNLLAESKSIRESILGRDHPDYAASLNSLANLYWNTRDYVKAEQHLLEAKAILGKTLGKQHPEFGINLLNLANLYWAAGNEEKATFHFNASAGFQQSMMVKALHHLSERELNKYLLKNTVHQSQLMSYAHHGAADLQQDTLVSGICYDKLLFFKGFLLNAKLQIQKIANADSGTAEKLKFIKAINRRLASELVKSFDQRDENKIRDLQSISEKVEKELSQKVSGIAEVLKQVNWKDVRRKLQPGEATIEFIHYRYYEKSFETEMTKYAALLIRSNTSENTPPAFIPLFDEDEMNFLLKSKMIRRADYVNHLYTVPDRGVSGVQIQDKSLYELIWKPIEPKLAGIRRIYFSPSGLLHRINIGAIPIGEEETLNNKYQLIELASTRQIVLSKEPLVKAQNAVLYGAIQYNPDSSILVATGDRGTSEIIITSRGEEWNYLKWTDKEVNAIKTILESDSVMTQVFKGSDAKEENFKGLGVESHSPKIIHLATHGYFFEDPEIRLQSAAVSSQQSTVNKSHNSYIENRQPTGNSPESAASINAEPVFKTSDNPMIRSGLILAGGNYAWKTGRPLNGRMEDGILTAYEISQMNLANTELVVLSACETGLGDIQGDEGVYGLQRAFKIAGVRYIIMSLWQIPDQETKEFMVDFYKNWLENKLSIPDAFRLTQSRMKERFINPYQWAGFVLVE